MSFQYREGGPATILAEKRLAQRALKAKQDKIINAAVDNIRMLQSKVGKPPRITQPSPASRRAAQRSAVGKKTGGARPSVLNAAAKNVRTLQNRADAFQRAVSNVKELQARVPPRITEPSPASRRPPRITERSPASRRPPKITEPSPASRRPPKITEPSPASRRPPKITEPSPASRRPPKPPAKRPPQITQPSPASRAPPKITQPSPASRAPPKITQPSPASQGARAAGRKASGVGVSKSGYPGAKPFSYQPPTSAKVGKVGAKSSTAAFKAGKVGAVGAAKIGAGVAKAGTFGALKAGAKFGIKGIVAAGTSIALDAVSRATRREREGTEAFWSTVDNVKQVTQYVPFLSAIVEWGAQGIDAAKQEEETRFNRLCPPDLTREDLRRDYPDLSEEQAIRMAFDGMDYFEALGCLDFREKEKKQKEERAKEEERRRQEEERRKQEEERRRQEEQEQDNPIVSCRKIYADEEGPEEPLPPLVERGTMVGAPQNETIEMVNPDDAMQGPFRQGGM